MKPVFETISFWDPLIALKGNRDDFGSFVNSISIFPLKIS